MRLLDMLQDEDCQFEQNLPDTLHVTIV